MGSNLYSKEKSRYFESVMREAGSYDLQLLPKL